MASKALTDQVAAKWQDSFNRLNRGAPGISGLMGFSRVRDLHRPPRHVLVVSLFNSETWRRHGQLLQMFCTPGSLERLRRTLVSICALSDALNAPVYSVVVDTNEVRSAFDVLMQCRMLPMLLESFVGASLFIGTIAVPEHRLNPQRTCAAISI